MEHSQAIVSARHTDKSKVAGLLSVTICRYIQVLSVRVICPYYAFAHPVFFSKLRKVLVCFIVSLMPRAFSVG